MTAIYEDVLKHLTKCGCEPVYAHYYSWYRSLGLTAGEARVSALEAIDREQELKWEGCR